MCWDLRFTLATVLQGIVTTRSRCYFTSQDVIDPCSAEFLHSSSLVVSFAVFMKFDATDLIFLEFM